MTTAILYGLLSKKSGLFPYQKHYRGSRDDDEEATKLHSVSVRKDEYVSKSNYDHRRRNGCKKMSRRGIHGHNSTSPVENEHAQHPNTRLNSNMDTSGQWGSLVLWMILAVVLFTLAVNLSSNDLPSSPKAHEVAKTATNEPVDLGVHGSPHIDHNDAKLVSEDFVNFSPKDPSRVSRTLSSATPQPQDIIKAPLSRRGADENDPAMLGPVSDAAEHKTKETHLKKEQNGMHQSEEAVSDQSNVVNLSAPIEDKEALAQRPPRNILGEEVKKPSSQASGSGVTKKKALPHNSFSMDIIVQDRKGWQQQPKIDVPWDDSALPPVQKFDRELIFDDGLSMAFGAKATLVRPSVEIAKEHCKQPGSVVFDIGSDVGSFAVTLHKARSQTKIYCFEPVPTYADYIRHRVKFDATSYPEHVISNPFGLSDRVEDQTYWAAPDKGTRAYRFLDGPTAITEKIDAHFMPLDMYMDKNDINRLDVVRINTGGDENKVIRGMRNTLAKLCPDLPVIMIEAGNRDVEQLVFGGAETEVAWLLTLGYRTPTTIGEEKPSLLKAKTLVLLPSPDVVCSDIIGSSITFSSEGLSMRES